MNEVPELRQNQFGMSVKTFNKALSIFKPKDEILYFTVDKNSVSMELYPNDPIIMIDKDAIKMILNKIKEVEDRPKAIIDRSLDESINN